jgi:hypothetical protein
MNLSFSAVGLNDHSKYPPAKPGLYDVSRSKQLKTPLAWLRI